MKKILFAVLTTISGVVLLFSYRTSTSAVMPDSSSPTTDTESSTSTSSSSTTTKSESSSSSQNTTPTPTTNVSGLNDGTFVGSSTQTRWGPVQVQITVSGGTITDVQAIDYPTENDKDVRINNMAIPMLNAEALNAQSASIDMVSGATVTSQGYITSLQSALDQARA